MAKLKLLAEPPPTFTGDVPIPVAGGDPVTVKMTFKYRTKTQLDAFLVSRQGTDDADNFLEMVVGWPGHEEDFNRENVELLLEYHTGAALATYRAYVDELMGLRIKNSKP